MPEQVAEGEGIDRGWYVRPTLFADVDNRMRIAQDEIFGPVLTVIPYGDDDDAVRIANDSEYGLSGSVWTTDPERGMTIAAGVRTGTFDINQPYSMDPAAPFGGVKASGLGRELGREGLEAYLEVKAISGAPGQGRSRLVSERERVAWPRRSRASSAGVMPARRRTSRVRWGWSAHPASAARTKRWKR